MQDFYSYQYEDIQILQTPTLWRTYKNYNYIIAKDQKAIIVDPGEFTPIQKTVEANQLSVKAIILTHHHADHIGATQQFVKNYNCPVLGFAKEHKRLPPLDQSFREDEVLKIAGYDCQILHLPGHTVGLCALYFKDLNLLFSNDLIFSLGCGRVFEGTAEQMFESLSRVRNLPDETVLFASHEYTLANLQFGLHLFHADKKLQSLEAELNEKWKRKIPTVPTTLKFEKEHNPFLRWDDPIIRKHLEMEEAKDWEVFAQIRHLKDQQN